MGATLALNSLTDDIPHIVNRFTDNRGIDCCIETAGSPLTCALAVKLVRTGGSIALVGIPHELVPMDLFTVVDKEIRLQGVFRYANQYPDAISVLAGGMVDFTQLLTNIFPLIEIESAFQTSLGQKSTSIKTVITDQ